MVPAPVAKTTRLVNNLEHVVVKKSLLRGHGEPRPVIRPQVLVVLLVAARWRLSCLKTNYIENAFGSEIQIHQHPRVLPWVLCLCGYVINIQDVLSIDGDDYVLWLTVGSGRSSHVLSALLLHSDVHVVIVCKLGLIINVLPIKVRIVLHLQRVENVPGHITAEVLVGLLVSLSKLFLRNLVQS